MDTMAWACNTINVTLIWKPTAKRPRNETVGCCEEGVEKYWSELQYFNCNLRLR